MLFLLMVFFVRLGHTGSALLAFVILARASDVVHSEFRHLDILRTD